MYTEKQQTHSLALQTPKQPACAAGHLTDHSLNSLTQCKLKSMIDTSPLIVAQRKGMVIQREIPNGTREEGIPGEGTYGEAYDKNLQKEIAIGKSLSSNSTLTEVAKTIGEKSEEVAKKGLSPQEVANRETERLEKAEEEKDSLEGAAAYKKGKDTLDAHVFGTMLEVEKRKAKLSEPRANVADVYDKDKKKGKIEEFDAPLKEAKKNALPLDAQTFIGVWPKKISQMTEEIQDIIKKSFDNPAVADAVVTADVQYEYDQLPSAARQVLLKVYRQTNLQEDDIKDAWVASDEPTMKAAGESMKDTHNHGNHINMVNDKTIWFNKTKAKGLPMISGPSGHTMRYLNYYQDLRDTQEGAGVDTSKWPTLYAARLVMLGNLMPPKMHHSYTEIMVASRGAGLEYRHPENYDDLKEQPYDAQPIAKAAYDAISKEPPAGEEEDMSQEGQAQ